MIAVRALLLLLVLLLPGACGIPTEDHPEPLPTAAVPQTESYDDDRPGGPRLTVYLVRGAVLVPVQRRTSAVTTAQALELLVEGPTRAEAAAGVSTALAPEVVAVSREPAEDTATVEVTRGFTGITGGNQLLAVAQVVFTLTEVPTVSDVRFTVEGVPVEVPTDQGLTARPVGRADYGTVAPAEPAATGTPATGTPAGGTSGPD